MEESKFIQITIPHSNHNKQADSVLLFGQHNIAEFLREKEATAEMKEYFGRIFDDLCLRDNSKKDENSAEIGPYYFLKVLLQLINLCC